MAEIFSTATEYIANAISLTRGSYADIVSVGTFFTTDPLVVPTPAQFTAATLVAPTHPLGDGVNYDVVTLVGPRGGAVSLPPGDYQVWVLIKTANEDIIRRVDVLEVK